MSIKNFINNDSGVIIFSDKQIDIRNYQDILSFDENNFKIKFNNKNLVFLGKKISVILLKEEELIITGDIDKIEYR